MLSYLIHGLSTGHFKSSFELLMTFGLLYAVLGLTLGVVFVIASSVRLVNSIIILSVFSILAGTLIGGIRYEELSVYLIAFIDKYIGDHILVAYIFNLVAAVAGFYVTEKSYRREKKREALLTLIFLGIVISIILVALLTRMPGMN